MSGHTALSAASIQAGVGVAGEVAEHNVEDAVVDAKKYVEELVVVLVIVKFGYEQLLETAPATRPVSEVTRKLFGPATPRLSGYASLISEHDVAVSSPYGESIMPYMHWTLLVAFWFHATHAAMHSPIASPLETGACVNVPPYSAR